MISSLCWVPRGVAKALPVVIEPTEDELAEAEAAAAEADAHPTDSDDPDGEEKEDEEEGSDADMDGDEAVARAQRIASSMARGGGEGGEPANAIELAMRELDMDHYDDSDEENVVARVLGGRRGGLAAMARGEDEDEYVTLGEEEDDDEDSQNSELDDFTIRPTDLLILAAKNEDDVSNLEVWLYEEADEAGGEPNAYVHHDIMLPAFPLALAWMDFDPTGTRAAANMVAVATLEPGIEIWDLDVVDAVEPVATLGGEERRASGAAAGSSGQGEGEDGEGAAAAGKKKKLKKTKKGSKAAPAGPKLVAGSHEDSVLCLSWCRDYRNVLASGSADCTVKVWDVSRQACEHTLRHHSGKVQGVAWNPAEAPVLLTGAFDKTACLVDVRCPEARPARWQLSADVEALCWHPHEPACFLVSAEDGVVACMDARKGAGSDPVFRLAASTKPACALSFCPGAPGLLATASTDKHVKLWDVTGGQPSLVASEELQIGALFSAGFCVDAPYLLAVGGAAGEVVVWDIRSNPDVMDRFPDLRRWRRATSGTAAAAVARAAAAGEDAPDSD